MKIIFYFGHPAQFLFLRKTIKTLKVNGNQIKILIKSKDVLEDLILNDDLEYTNILSKERGKSKVSVALSFIKRSLKILPILIKNKPDLIIGTDATIAQLGKLLSINRITITEDDYEVIKTLADLSYPFTQTILCPNVCDVGKWNDKKIGYDGYMKLGYLHPNVFSVNNKLVKKYKLLKDFILIRLSNLSAHHDFGIQGINHEILDKLIHLIEKKSYQVLISSENKLIDKYKKFILNINPNDMHHILANASLLICDSQSMTVEAAMLGIPSIRISGFTGRISVLEELEHKYKLTFGINPSSTEKLFLKVDELMKTKNIKEKFSDLKDRMLFDKIDVTSFMIWFIESYPESIETMRENPDYQYKFRKTQ